LSPILLSRNIHEAGLIQHGTMGALKLKTESPLLNQQHNFQEANLDHVIDILAYYDHPMILVGRAAHRWMGSAGARTSSCDLLIRNNELEKIASSLVETGQWVFHDTDAQNDKHSSPLNSEECWGDVVLRRLGPHQEIEYHHLNLWSEITYHMNVEDCPVVEVPDVYPWHHLLVEESWHPAVGREDGWWFGPCLHPQTKIGGLSERATRSTVFPEGLPRGISSSKNYSILIPRIPAYLDALIYHATRYKFSKPALASSASWQIRNLTRYLYLELPHQQLPLLIELEEDEFMEKYLQNFTRKPFYVYRKGPDGELEATRVKEWDPTSYPHWCRAK
jgi:hypothetical protein